MRLKWLTPFLVLLALFVSSSFGSEGEVPYQQAPVDPQANVGSLSEATPEMARGKEEVRVLAPSNYPPFSFVDDEGRLIGIAVDLLAMAAKRLGLELEFKETELSTIPKMMEGREGDITLLVADPPGPGNSVITTQPFMESQEAIITQHDKVGIHGLKDLRGSAVTVIQGGPAMANLVAAYPDVKIVPRDSVLEALQDVVSGHADAYVGSLGTATYLMQKYGLSQLKIAALAQDRAVWFEMGVRNDKPQLLSILQQALDSVDDAERQALVNRYFSPDSVSGIELSFSLTPSEREWLKAHSEMRLGVNGSWPPIESFGPDGRYEGISSEYVRIVSELLGVQMVPVPELSWTQTLQAARERKIDVIALLAKSPARAAFLLFTKPYLTSQGAIVTRRDAPFLSGLKDLEGKRVAVVTGEVAEEQIAVKYPAIDLVRVNTIQEGLKAVADGKAAGFAESLAVVSYALSSLGLDSLKVAATTGFTYEYCMGVRRDWPELVAFLDEALATVKDRNRSAIHDRWVNVRIEHRTDWTLIWSILALVAGVGGSILVVILVWNRRLTREVAVRKQAEEKIGEQAALLSGLLDSLPDMVFFKNISGVYLGCNPAFSRFVGRPREEITGRTDYDLFAKEVADLFRDNDRVIIKSGEPQHREEWVVYPDGNRFFLEISKAPLRDGTGRVTGVLGVGRDITERKQADELKVERSVAVEAAERAEHARALAEKVQAELRLKMVEIERFNRLAMGREQRILELKREVTVLALEQGKDTPYPSLLAADGAEDEQDKVGLVDDPVAAGVNLSELLDIQQLQELLDHFCRAMGVASAIIDLKGEILAAAHWQRACTDFHRVCEMSCARCLESDTELALKLQEGKDFALYRCKNGMTDAASPIIVGDRHLANVFVGQFHLSDPDPEFFLRQAEECGFDPEEYLAAVREAPIIAEAKLPNILGFLSGFSNLIAQLSLEKRRGQLTGESAMSLAEDAEHAREEIARYRDHLEKLVEERTEDLQRSEERTRLLLDSVGEGIYGIDEKGLITFVNPVAVRLLGYENAAELLGRENHSLMHHSHEDGTPYPLADCRLRQALNRQEPVSCDAEVFWRKDGTSFPVAYSGAPILHGGTYVGGVIAFSDITELKKAEKELNVAKDEADDANRAKSDFLARMSHEIRTPMNAVIGMAHLCLQTELTAKQHDYVSKIYVAGHNLLGIINDILDFSKIEAGKLELEEIDFRLDEVLDNLANIVTLKAEEKGLEVLFRVPPKTPNHLVGDPLRLGQVLINLVNNAVKFTEKGHIVISAELAEETAETATLQFAVKDSGIGLSEEQIGRLFQSFSQADGSTTRKFGGTGLGLAICKRLVEMMGGTVRVESEPGQGSSFIFAAVLGKSKGREEKTYIPAVDLRGMRSLVVDDNPLALSILKDALESFSFKVDTAGSGQDALEALEKAASEGAPYELVLMDWQMPGMNGIETVRRIKAIENLAEIPQILMVTAFGREEIMREADTVGINSFLVKPVGQSVLFDTIMGIFGYESQRKPPKGYGAAAEPEGLAEIRGARVLLTEDNEINQQIALELLEKAGMIVDVANNGRESLEAVQARDYDLVLMDIQMPQMDGLEAARRIRACGKPNVESLPIVAMTAHAMTGDREKSLEAGMNDHITKPIDPRQLMETLAKWIKPGKREVPSDLASHTEQMEKALAEDDLPLEGRPGISIKSGLARVAGNRGLYKKLLGQFCEKNRDAVRAIQTAMNERDSDLAARLAHTIKGVGANLGADPLSHAAAEVERAVKAGETALDNLLVNLGTKLEEVMASIDGLLSPKGEKSSADSTAGGALPPAAFDPTAVAGLLREVVVLLDVDLGQAVQRVEELAGILESGPASGEYQTLVKALDDFDTDEAIKAVKAIAMALNLDGVTPETGESS